MKKIFSAGLAALFCLAACVACDDPKNPLTAPATAAVENITANSADIVWKCVPGAESYLVTCRTVPPVGETRMIGPSKTETTTSLSGIRHTLTGLEFGTAYSFSVQAVRGDEKSEPFTGIFTTAGPEETFVWAGGRNFGQYYNDQTLNLIIGMAEFDMEGDTGKMNGRFLSLDLIVPFTEAGNSQEFIPLPVGTYTVGFSEEPFTAIIGGYTSLAISKNGASQGDMPIGRGTIEVTGAPGAYTITANLFTADGGNIFVRYTGPVNIPNDNYVPPTEPVDAGRLTLDYFKATPNGNLGADVFEIIGFGQGVEMVDGMFRGDGWTMISTLFVPLGSDLFPAGVYPIDLSQTPGTAMAGLEKDGPVGTWLIRIEGGKPADARRLVSGTATVTSREGVYTFAFDAVDQCGSRVTFSVVGKEGGLIW